MNTSKPKSSDKVLYVGHLTNGQTSLMRAEAMEALGVDLVRFDSRRFLNQRSFLERRFSDIFERSPALSRLNKELRSIARNVLPAIVWFDKQEFITDETINELKRLGAALVFYTPDPYFQQDWHQTRLLNSTLQEYDFFVTTKTYEIERFREFGQTLYMTHGYCNRVHKPHSIPENKKIDFGFVGSWEPRRQAFLEKAAASNLDVMVWGFGWGHLVDGRAGIRTRMRLRRMSNGENFSVEKSKHLDSRIIPGEIYGDAYAAALSTSRISPGLLRTTLYPDQHTTRTFEIPACGAMLLAERTIEHQALFDEDKEAVFFDNEEEMIEKAIWYSSKPEAQKKIATAGRLRCENSGYSYKERIRPVLNEISRSIGLRDIVPES